MGYVFSLIKFVPDPAKGESVNLGAVAGDDESGDWDMRTISKLTRAKSIDDTGALEGALSFLGDIEGRIAALDVLPGFAPERISAALLERWSADMNNSLQFSEPMPLVAETAAEALDLIFEELVVDPAKKEFRFLKKHPAVAQTARAYREAKIPDSAVAKVVEVEAASFTGSFDFGVYRRQVLQLVKCWSFQLPSQTELAEEVKAWAWLVERLAESGGEAYAAASGRFKVGKRAHIAVVYVPPSLEQSAPAFDEATAAFSALNVKAVEAAQAREVAAIAARRLGISPQ